MVNNYVLTSYVAYGVPHIKAGQRIISFKVSGAKNILHFILMVSKDRYMHCKKGFYFAAILRKFSDLLIFVTNNHLLL